MIKNVHMRLIVPCLIAIGFCNCGNQQPTNNNSLTPKEISKLKLKEISGLQYVNNTLWGIEDSGNENAIYKIDPNTGKHTTYVVNAPNTDWEDLTTDAQGNLYIADTGNNDNDRKNLSIIKVSPNNPQQVLQTTTFYYPEQKDFPAKKHDRNFDCEGIIEQNGYFYLFSKNRCFESDGTVQIHKVPNKPGNFAAENAGSFVTCDNFRKCAIAGADISPDGKTVALISGDKLWLITNFKNNDFAHGTITPYELGELTQKESVCFTDNKTLYIADEKSKKEGGKLYLITLE